MARIKLTHLEADGRLPMICLVCGHEANMVRNKVFSWHPWWVFVTSPFTMFPAAFTRQASLQAPLCEKHRSCWEIRWWAGLAGFVLLTVAAVILGILILPNTVTIGLWITWGLALFTWLIVTVILALTAIRAVEITDRHIVLSGVAPEFIQAKDDCDRGPDKLQQPIAIGYGPAHWSKRTVDQSQERETGIQDKSRIATQTDDAFRE